QQRKDEPRCRAGARREQDCGPAVELAERSLGLRDRGMPVARIEEVPDLAVLVGPENLHQRTNTSASVATPSAAATTVSTSTSPPLNRAKRPSSNARSTAR